MIFTDTRPAIIHETIVPSDVASLYEPDGQPRHRAIFIEIGGDISITDGANNTVVYTVPNATLLPFAPKRVNATNTTAVGIHGWR